MDISNLKLKQHLLMDHFYKVRYCANKRRNIEKCIELVLIKGSSSNITSYEDLFFSGSARARTCFRKSSFQIPKSESWATEEY